MKVLWDYLKEADKQYLLSQVPSFMLFEELDRRARECEDDAPSLGPKEKFEFQDRTERECAFRRLSSKYPLDVTLLICGCKMEVPLWLQKEILKVRMGGQVK